MKTLFKLFASIFIFAGTAFADYPVAAGATSQCVPVFIANSSLTNGGGRTGITAGLSGFGCSYIKSTAPTTPVAITLTGGGFTEMDATGSPGMYNICPANTAWTGFTGLGGEWTEITCVGGANVSQSQTRFPINPPALLVNTAPNSIKESAFAPTGLAQAGSSTSIVNLANTETANDITGQELCIQSGVGAKQCRPITAYNTGTKAATVSPLLTNPPAAGDGYQIGGFVAGAGGACPSAAAIVSAFMLTNRSSFQSNVGTYGEAWPAIAGNVNGTVTSAGTCNAIGAGGISATSFAANTPWVQATAQAVGTIGQVTLAAGAPYNNGSLNNMNSIYISESTGAGAGQIACISDYNSTSKVAKLAVKFKVPLSGTAKYMILPTPNCNLSLYPSSH